MQNEQHLTDIALRCEPGSFTVLLGGLRAGKTSLLRIMAGLDRPSAGRVLWNGQDVTHLPVRERDVAMVYQQFVNYPSLTVYENIASPLRIQRRLSPSELDRRVRAFGCGHFGMNPTVTLHGHTFRLVKAEEDRGAMQRQDVPAGPMTLPEYRGDTVLDAVA